MAQEKSEETRVASQSSKPIQVWLDEEEQKQFERLKTQDVRNTSDMVRYLIRQEYLRRRTQVGA